jgi:uncharacterized membrane protein (DUF2068 family)
MPRPPGTEKPRRYLPTFHWELLACGLSGHELLGTDVAELRPRDEIVARDDGDLRWHRCVRCDSWVALPRPAAPTHEVMPPREQIELPDRGKALRDKFVLRLIAIDRGLHFVVLAALALLLLMFSHRVAHVRRLFNRVVADYGGASHVPKHGLVHDLQRLVTLQSGTLRIVALVAALYAALEGLEAIGLWLMRRWAEYLTFVATIAFVPLEVWELTKTVSVFKVAALVVNVAIVVYLLVAKRLFGIRGGAEAERRERERDSGWPVLEATAPRAGTPADAPVRKGAGTAS